MYCTNCGAEIAPNAAFCTSCGVQVGAEKNFCANCGQAVNANQVVCLSCGCQLPNAAGARPAAFGGAAPGVAPSGKSASTATILSCLVLGLGQMYLGQVIKGVILLVAGTILSLFTYGLFALPIWIIVMVDAYRIGKKLEAGQSVGEWEFF